MMGRLELLVPYITWNGVIEMKWYGVCDDGGFTAKDTQVGRG